MDKRDRVEAILKRATGEDPSFPHGPSVKWPKVYRGLRDDGKTKSEAAAISNAAWNKYRRWGEAGNPGPKSAAEYEATRGRKARKRKGIPLKVTKHHGPGPHPSGSPQKVHGIRGGGGASYESNRTVGPDGSVSSSLTASDGTSISTSVSSSGDWQISGAFSATGAGGEEPMLDALIAGLDSPQLASLDFSGTSAGQAPSTPAPTDTPAPSTVPTTDATADSDRFTDSNLRPDRLDGIIGQELAKEQVEIAITAAKELGQPLDHMIFTGPPGLGKTTFARAVANEMGSPIRVVTGPALKTREQMQSLLLTLQPNEILFIDEIHAVPPAIQELLYPVMEDFEMDVQFGDQSMRMEVAPFTLMGATTNPEGLARPLKDRFGNQIKMEYYEPEKLAQLATISGSKMGMQLDADSAMAIASRGRGTPRIVNHMTKHVRNYAIANNAPVTPQLVSDAFKLWNVDDRGLTGEDRQVLRILRDNGKAGLSTISSITGMSQDAVSEVIEPYLMQSGFIQRGSGGREITQAGLDHLAATEGIYKAADPKPVSDDYPSLIELLVRDEDETSAEEGERTLADATAAWESVMAELNRRIVAKRIRKHGSSHDESSHGNRGGTLVRAKPSTDPARFTPATDSDRYDRFGGLNRPGSVSQGDRPIVSQSNYDKPRLSRKEKALLQRWESFRRNNPFMHPEHVAQVFDRQERSRLMDLFDKTEQPWLRRVFKAADIAKHGSHDQTSHGNWSRGGSAAPVSLFPAANAGSDIIALPNSLGIERGDMPQIPEIHQSAFLAELAAEGVKAEQVSVPAASLKPMQHHLNRTKIDRAKQGIVDHIPKLTRVKSFISSDGYILDGHHRWAAYAELGENIPAIRVDLNARELLTRAARFNYEHGVETRSIATTVAKLLSTIAKHYGPGPHSGTGTPQTVHGVDSSAASTATLVRENVRRLQDWERSTLSPTYDNPGVKSAARSLFEKALVNEARISKVIVPVVGATGGEFHTFEERVKFEGSIRSKIVRTADEGAFTIEEAAANVRDLNRYTVVWEPDEWANGYEKFRTAMTESGWKIYDSKEKNFWDPGDYYDGFNVQFTNGGSFVEVQFGTPRSLKLKERSHAIYMKVREMDDTPERARMMDDMYAIWHADRSHVPPNTARFGFPQAKGF